VLCNLSEIDYVLFRSFSFHELIKLKRGQCVYRDRNDNIFIQRARERIALLASNTPDEFSCFEETDHTLSRRSARLFNQLYLLSIKLYLVEFGLIWFGTVLLV